MTDEQPLNMRAWYGLPAEIAVGELWRQVSVGGLPLPHLGLVDIHLRQGIPHRERKRLTYWHELGHLETVPLALPHALVMWLTGRRRCDTSWTLRLLIGTLAWLAGTQPPRSVLWRVNDPTMRACAARRAPNCPWLCSLGAE